MSAWRRSTSSTKKATEHPRWYNLSATAAADATVAVAVVAAAAVVAITAAGATAASALGWAVVVVAAVVGGVAAAGAEATGAGGATIDAGAVGRKKLRFLRPLHQSPSALRKQARPRKPPPTLCAVRHVLGLGREARGLGASSFEACPCASAPLTPACRQARVGTIRQWKLASGYTLGNPMVDFN
jgi:hypothetical protein